jgi:hypothetical protein
MELIIDVRKVDAMTAHRVFRAGDGMSCRSSDQRRAMASLKACGDTRAYCSCDPMEMFIEGFHFD